MIQLLYDTGNDSGIDLNMNIIDDLNNLNTINGAIIVLKLYTKI